VLLCNMKRFLLAAVLVCIFSLSSESARADWNTPGDSRLVIEPGICQLSSLQSRSYCGPTLTVRVPPLLSNGEGVSVSVNLVGPMGPVTLEYESTAVIGNGAMYMDTDFWQNKTQTGTPTSLPSGEYTFVWQYTQRGVWSCSKYYKDGCIWIKDSSTTYTYKFNWVGAKLETYPVKPSVVTPTLPTPTSTAAAETTAPSTLSTKAAPTLTKRNSVSAKLIANFAKLSVFSDSRVSLKVASSSSKYCKVKGTTLHGLKAGLCRLVVTVTLKSGARASSTVTLKVAK